MRERIRVEKLSFLNLCAAKQAGAPSTAFDSFVVRKQHNPTSGTKSKVTLGQDGETAIAPRAIRRL